MLSKSSSSKKAVPNMDYLEKVSEVQVFLEVNRYYELLSNYRNREYYQKLANNYKNIGDTETAKYFLEKAKMASYIIKDGESLKKVESMLDGCILQTNRFNTDTCLLDDGSVNMTDNFYSWYYSWVSYIENMDDETLLAFRKCRYEGKGLENFTLNGYPTFSTVEEELEKPKVKQYMFKGETATKNIRQKLA